MNSDLQYMRELLAAFGHRYDLDPEEVMRQVWSNYDNEWTSDLVRSLMEKTIDVVILSRLVHTIMFSEFLTNAGQFRKANDKWQGSVEFGKERARSGGAEFPGVLPRLIQEQLGLCNQILSLNEINAEERSVRYLIDRAMRFYQRFVRVHPFYDGNGRIARLLVTVFLSKYSVILDWAGMQASGERTGPTPKFIKKLNDCHRRDADKVNREPFEKMMGLLVDYVAQFASKQDIE